MGYDNRESLGDKETGAKAALPLWMNFMRVAIAGKDNEAFPGDLKFAGSSSVHVARAAVKAIH